MASENVSAALSEKAESKLDTYGTAELPICTTNDTRLAPPEKCVEEEPDRA